MPKFEQPPTPKERKKEKKNCKIGRVTYSAELRVSQSAPLPEESKIKIKDKKINSDSLSTLGFKILRKK